MVEANTSDMALDGSIWLSSDGSIWLSRMRGQVNRVFCQIEYLRRHEDNGRQTRRVLLGRVAEAIAAFGMDCDLPGGYADPEDPFGPDALGLLRASFAELRAGDYPCQISDCWTQTSGVTS